jgi:hypothetical protein
MLGPARKLAFRLPVLLGLAAVVAGCYTILKHPETEVTQDEYADHGYSDCASCHSAAFMQPLYPDPYEYVSDPFLWYYDCPWWLSDCSEGAEYVDEEEGGGGSEYLTPLQGDLETGRNLGNRGVTYRRFPSPDAGSDPDSNEDDRGQSGTPSAQQSKEPEPPEESQQPGREMKEGKKKGQGDPPSEKGDPEPPPKKKSEEESKEEPEEKPKEEAPEEKDP